MPSRREERVEWCTLSLFSAGISARLAGVPRFHKGRGSYGRREHAGASGGARLGDAAPPVRGRARKRGEERAQPGERASLVDRRREDRLRGHGGPPRRARGHRGALEGKMFSLSYVADGEDPQRQAPVTFAYNGGPGCASVPINFGGIGPRRVVDGGLRPPGHRPSA
jgi:hypothetical protein